MSVDDQVVVRRLSFLQFARQKWSVAGQTIVTADQCRTVRAFDDQDSRLFVRAPFGGMFDYSFRLVYPSVRQCQESVLLGLALRTLFQDNI